MIIHAGIGHAPGHTVRLSCLCLIHRELLSIHALRSLIASFTKTRNAGLLLPPVPRILLLTLTYVPKMQQTSASIDWMMRQCPACVNPVALLGVNQSACALAAASGSGFLWLLSLLHHWVYWILGKEIRFSWPLPHKRVSQSVVYLTWCASVGLRPVQPTASSCAFLLASVKAGCILLGFSGSNQEISKPSGFDPLLFGCGCGHPFLAWL